MAVITVLTAFIAGAVIGLILNVNFTDTINAYLSLISFICILSLINAYKTKIENKYNFNIFISKLIIMSILSLLLSAIGDLLGLPVFMAVIIAVSGFILKDVIEIIEIKITKKDKIRQKMDDIR